MCVCAVRRPPCAGSCHNSHSLRGFAGDRVVWLAATTAASAVFVVLCTALAKSGTVAPPADASSALKRSWALGSGAVMAAAVMTFMLPNLVSLLSMLSGTAVHSATAGVCGDVVGVTNRLTTARTLQIRSLRVAVGAHRQRRHARFAGSVRWQSYVCLRRTCKNWAGAVHRRRP